MKNNDASPGLEYVARRSGRELREPRVHGTRSYQTTDGVDLSKKRAKLSAGDALSNQRIAPRVEHLQKHTIAIKSTALGRIPLVREVHGHFRRKRISKRWYV